MSVNTADHQPPIRVAWCSKVLEDKGWDSRFGGAIPLPRLSSRRLRLSEPGIGGRASYTGN